MTTSHSKNMNWQSRLARTLVAVGVIGGPHPKLMQAATVNVGNSAALVSAVANCSDGDTIVLTNNITVSAEIAISAKGLTIQGNNYLVCVPVPGLNGSGVTNATPSTFRVFNINASGKTNTLQNMSVLGGSPSSDSGGIWNNNGTLVLQGVTVAQSGGANCSGGGLENSSGTLYLRDCNFNRNAANHGGGFLNGGAGATMFMERCTFSENQSLSSDGGGGAGENQQTLYANNSTFANNQSTELGGGINNYGGTSYVVDCTFVGNIAYGTGDLGGAIAQHSDGGNNGTVTLVNSVFAYNYHFNGSAFVLNDINDLSGDAPEAYYSIFHSTTNQLGSGSVGTMLYTGDISGTNDTLFYAGANAGVLGPDGTEVGPSPIYRPSLAIVSPSQTPTAVLKAGSFAFGKGARAAFCATTATPVVGYYNGSSWVALSGSSPASYEVTADQNGTSRGGSNTAGAVNSTASRPTITTPPANQTVAVGGPMNLSVAAAGIGPLYYQWFRNGGMVLGATNSAVTLASAGVTNSGVYYVMVTNAYGLSISLPAVVTVGVPQLLGWGDNSTSQLGALTSDVLSPESLASNVVAAAAGNFHSVYLKGDGTVWAMGDNQYGQLGDGTKILHTNPELVASNMVSVAVGADHSMFLRNDGTLWAVGFNGDGELGDGNTTQQSSPVLVTNNVVAMAGGAWHSLFLRGDGTLWVMGQNDYGQLGNGTFTGSLWPECVASNVVALAAGQNHSLYLTSEGALWAMGQNEDGQLGDGGGLNRNQAVAVGSNVVAVAGGGSHSLFVQRDGSLWTMGDNQYGQLGAGATTQQDTPEAVDGNVVAVTAGDIHSLYLKSDGTLWAMGMNSEGQLGDGTMTTRYSPVSVNGMCLGNIVSGCNANNTLAIGVPLPPLITNQPASQAAMLHSTVNVTVTASGFAPLAYQWYFNGDAISGATATNYSQSGVTTARSGDYTVVVSNPGGSVTSSVAVLTVNQATPSVTTWPTATAIIFGQTLASSMLAGGAATVGGSFAFTTPGTAPAVTALQSVTFTPTNTADYITVTGSVSVTVLLPATITTQPTNQSVAAGGMVNLNVTASGTEPFYYQWFKNGGMVLGATNSTLTLANATVQNSGVYYAVVTNAYTLNISQPVTVAVGTPQLLAWGDNQYGQLADGTELNAYWPESVASDLVVAAAGADHSLFVKTDNKLWTVGFNGDGELGDGTTLTRSNAISAASNVVAVAAGAWHSLFLKGDGTLWAMGQNDYGQLGNGTSTGSLWPESVASNVVAVAAGQNHSLFLKSDGTLWAMGQNDIGQLGDGTTINRSNAVMVASNVVAVAAGGYHSLYLRSDGTLLGTGDNGMGQLGDGTTINALVPKPIASNVVALAAGAYHSLYLESDGTLWGTGDNSMSQLGDGTTNNAYVPEPVASNVVAVTAGYDHSLYLKSDGSLWAMGDNGDGQLGDGTTTNRSSPVPVPGMSLATAVSGCAASHTLAVGASLAPVITSQPINQAVVAGSPATFTVAAEGVAPLSYQWQFNGTNLVSATNTSYTLTSIAVSDAGSYAVVVTNTAGSTVSTSAVLTVSVTVTVAANPADAGSVTGGAVYLPGASAVLAATASNAWQFISWNDGATNNPHFITVPDTNSTYTASFAPTAIIMVGENTNAGGSVSGSGTFVVGSTNPITAVASNGWIFVQWSNGSTNNPYGLMVASNLTITATFAPAATVATLALPPEGGFTAGDGTYAIGGSASVMATATNGWVFLNWNGTVTNNPWTFVVPSSPTVCTGNFAQVSTVTGLADPTNAGVVTGGAVYLVGTNAVLTAIASNAWQFLYWNDGTTNNPYVVTVPDTNITYTASFGATAAITVGANPLAGGSVSGGGTFLVGSTQPITAVASNGWIFVQWSDGTTANPYSIVVASNLTITATFDPAATVATVAVPPEGGLTAGDGTYAIGSSASVTATATNGWLFLNWNGSVTNNPWTFVVPSSATVCTANFAQVSTVTGLAYPTNAGSVAGGAVYPVGSNAVLTATASNNWQFVAWNDGATNNPYVITVPNTNVTYTANFGATATITAGANPSAGGTVTGGGTFLVGSTQPITAVASNHWIFVHWSDGTADNPYTILVESNRTFTAEFQTAATVTTVALPPQGGTTTGNGVYAIGSIAMLTATATNGWLFLNWDGTVTNYTQTGNRNNPLVFSVATDITHQANFAPVANDFVYTVLNTVPPQVEIIGYVGPTNGTITIPSTIAGMPVTSIASGALWWITSPKVHVPGSVTNIASSSIAAEILEIAAATAALVMAADALKDVGELDLIDMAADLAADLIEDLSDDDDLSGLKAVNFVADPPGSGNCDGSGFYTVGDEVVLSAKANDGWGFKSWDNGEETSERTVTVSEDEAANTFTAKFVQRITVTVEVNNEEGGTATGGGTFDVGEQTTLTATTNSGWRFSGWDDGSSDNPYVITVSEDVTKYTANFVEQVEVEAEADPTNGGYVLGAHTYDAGSVVTLTAITNSGWRFNGWFLDGFITNTPILVTVASPSLEDLITYTAKFVPTFTVTGLAYPTNAGSVAGGAVYDVGVTNVTLTATASNTWLFVQWNDGATNNPYVITTSGKDITYTATFAVPPLITAPPASLTVTYGSNATFSVTAEGTAPLSYQWYFSGTNISGAAASTYTRNGATMNDAGNYTVMVGNAGGSVTSSPAALTVLKASATVTLGNLSQTYDGTAKSVSVVTLPANLAVSVIYNGSASAPTNTGTYTVVATVNDANYWGGTTNSLVINPPPILEPIPDQVAYVLMPLVVTNCVSDSNLVTQPLTFGLCAGTPDGVWMEEAWTKDSTNGVCTNGVMWWAPTRDQARSTNTITVWMQDSASPPVLATNSFTVVVDDYVELSIGRTVLFTGHTSSVPVTLMSSLPATLLAPDSLTNVAAVIQVSDDRLAELTLTSWAPELGSASVQKQATNTWQIQFTAVAGQVFQTTQQLAQLQFLAVSNRSAFVPIWLSEVTNFQMNGQSVWRTLADPGRAVALGDEPLIEPFTQTNGYPNLVIYGDPGVNYNVLFAPVVTPAALWQPIWLGTMPTNMWTPVTGLTNTGPTMFFRASTHAD